MFCVWDQWTLCQGMQDEHSTRQQAWRDGHLGRSSNRQRDSEIIYPTLATRLVKLGSSYTVEDSRHANGQWLYRSHRDKDGRDPGLYAHSVSVRKSQWRGFRSDEQRLCEDQHTVKQKRIPIRAQKCSVFA